jgi:spectinomycin phosphotransferase
VRARPESLDDRSVVDGLREGWDFAASVTEYAPLGGGSYHWVAADDTGRRRFATVDDLARKAWLGDTCDAAFDGLRRAFDTALALRDAGLQFVVAPIATRTGASLTRLDPRYAMSLFPFLDGEPGHFERYEDDDHRGEVVAMLTELHAAAVATVPSTVGFGLPGRELLEAALADLDEVWTGGPLSEPARRAVGNVASELVELMTLADGLATTAQRRAGDWVVTHGEPHGGNTVRTSEGWALVDWDTVALGPPERDLWMLADRDRELYRELTGTEVDQTAIDFFRLTWDLKDLAEYLDVLRSPHEENADTSRHYQSLVDAPAIRERWAAQLD